MAQSTPTVLAQGWGVQKGGKHMQKHAWRLSGSRDLQKNHVPHTKPTCSNLSDKPPLSLMHDEGGGGLIAVILTVWSEQVVGLLLGERLQELDVGVLHRSHRVEGHRVPLRAGPRRRLPVGILFPPPPRNEASAEKKYCYRNHGGRGKT